MKYTFAVLIGALLVLFTTSLQAQSSPSATATFDCPVDQECIVEQLSIGGVVKEQRRVLSNGNTVWESWNQATGLFEPLLWVQHTQEVSSGDSTGRLHVGSFAAFHCESFASGLGQEGCTFLEMRIGGTPANPEGASQGVGWLGVDKTLGVVYFGGENFYKPALLTTDLVSPHFFNTTDIVAVFGWDGMRLYQQNGATRLDINSSASLLRSPFIIEASDGSRSLLIRDVSGNWRSSLRAYSDGGVWKMEERAYNGLTWQQLP